MYDLGAGGVAADAQMARKFWKLAVLSDVPEAHYRHATPPLPRSTLGLGVGLGEPLLLRIRRAFCSSRLSRAALYSAMTLSAPLLCVCVCVCWCVCVSRLPLICASCVCVCVFHVGVCFMLVCVGARVGAHAHAGVWARIAPCRRPRAPPAGVRC